MTQYIKYLYIPYKYIKLNKYFQETMLIYTHLIYSRFFSYAIPSFLFYFIFLNCWSWSLIDCTTHYWIINCSLKTLTYLLLQLRPSNSSFIFWNHTEQLCTIIHMVNFQAFEAFPVLSSCCCRQSGFPIPPHPHYLHWTPSFLCKLSSFTHWCLGGPCSLSRCSAPLVASKCPQVKQPDMSIFFNLLPRCALHSQRNSS